MAPAMPIVAAYRGELDWFPSHGPSRAGARIVLFSAQPGQGAKPRIGPRARWPNAYGISISSVQLGMWRAWPAAA